MRRSESSDGFWLCFLLNLLWEIGWGITAAVLLIFHIKIGLPGYWWILAACAWLLIALVKTWLIKWGAIESNRRDPIGPNKNPYSARTEDLMPTDRKEGES